MKSFENTKLIIDTIENNIYNNIDIKTISGLNYVSVAQLYRDFYSVTGHSIKEYIRKRRLSNALALVRQSIFSITDIAYRCGYANTADFCKSVKKAINITPSAYRNGDGFYYFPPINGYVTRQVEVKKEYIPETYQINYNSDKQVMVSDIRTSQSMAYDSLVSHPIETKAVSEFLQSNENFTGRLFGRNGKVAGSYYLLLSEMPGNIENINSLHYIGTLPSIIGTFATITVRYSYEEIQAAWDYLYYDWLQTSMFKHTLDPYFEEYIIKKGQPYKLKLYVPIIKNDSSINISVENIEASQFISCTMTGDNAEEYAADELMNYFTAEHLSIVDDIKQVLLCKEKNKCTYGIKLTKMMTMHTNNNIKMVTYESGKYAVLSGKCGSNYKLYANILLTWMRNNGLLTPDAMASDIKVSQSMANETKALHAMPNATLASQSIPFALYDISLGFNLVDMKIYCKIPD